MSSLLFFLLPSFSLLLLSLALRLPSVRRGALGALEAAARRLWVLLCRVLQLPLDESGRTRTRIRTGEAGPPGLLCKSSALAKHLQRHCGSLATARPAPWPRGDPHLQTLSSQLWDQDRDLLRFTRDHLLLRDGGVVALDWAVGARPGEYWGGTTPHLRALCHRALSQGFLVVVFHPRGTAGCPLTSARLTEFGDPADLEQAVSYVRGLHPSSALVAVSEGSGSGLLLSYLGESGSVAHLTAAAAISPVLLGQLWFQTAMPPVYRWGALFHRKQQLRRYASSFRGVLDVDRVLSSSTLRDFEETLFCSSDAGPSWGPRPPRCPAPSAAWALGERAYPAQDWGGYWERNEPLREADEVAVPVLCILSGDDPLLPPTSTLPLHLFRTNPYFLLLLTDRGGHCGFTEEEQGEGGRAGAEEEEEEERGGAWSHVAVLEFFRVVADFLKVEERRRPSWSAPQEEKSPAGFRNRISNAAPPPPPQRKRRPLILRRTRAQAAEQSRVEEEEKEEEQNFTWRRSYTR